jgi:hypothetical protein
MISKLFDKLGVKSVNENGEYILFRCSCSQLFFREEIENHVGHRHTVATYYNIFEALWIMMRNLLRRR